MRPPAPGVYVLHTHTHWWDSLNTTSTHQTHTQSHMDTLTHSTHTDTRTLTQYTLHTEQVLSHTRSLVSCARVAKCGDKCSQETKLQGTPYVVVYVLDGLVPHVVHRGPTLLRRLRVLAVG